MKKHNLCDVLGQDARYVILTKNNNIFILDSPTDKDIRKKANKSWCLVGWVKKSENGITLLRVLAKFYNNKFKKAS